ncbi:MAG: tRNA pseudouridine(38-40) synthase TruA [Gemmatimonadaceae bacterium]
MTDRTVQLVLHYDGAGFHGWQQQPGMRTVQGVLEEALERLCGARVAALGSGRTDAGVHARGQSAGVRVPARWAPKELRRALNAVLPGDVWVAAAAEMRPEFHARYSAVSRRYAYYVGLDDGADSPFRRPREYAFRRPIDRATLDTASSLIAGEHRFLAFAVRGTAPPGDDHRCQILTAAWERRDGGFVFRVTANRFLHQMVRFLVGTMLDMASGRRPVSDMLQLLGAAENTEVSPPAPPHGLFLECVEYPAHLYVQPA